MEEIEQLKATALAAIDKISARQGEFADLQARLAEASSPEQIAELRAQWQADLERVDVILEKITPLVEE